MLLKILISTLNLSFGDPIIVNEDDDHDKVNYNLILNFITTVIIIQILIVQ